jgi:hypothetical protein
MKRILVVSADDDAGAKPAAYAKRVERKASTTPLETSPRGPIAAP